MFLKKLVLRIIKREKYSSETFINFLKKKGVTIGERTCFYAPFHTNIDLTRPWMIEIGNDVQIASDFTILTHGFDWCVLKKKYGDVLGSCGYVKIGNNVFIGKNVTILKGVTIGDNVIIGAGSVVTNNIPNDVVAVGVPCKVIMDLDDYYKKRRDLQLYEARVLVERYRKVFKKNPSINDLNEFLFLFQNDYDNLPDSFVNKLNICGNYDISLNKLKESYKPYDCFEDFLKKI